MANDALKLEFMDLIRRVDELRFLAVEHLHFDEAAFWRDTKEFLNAWLVELLELE